MSTTQNPSTGMTPAPNAPTPATPVTAQDVQTCLYGEHNGFHWYHVDNPASPHLDQLAQLFGLHELAVEDCRVPGTRAKIDEYGDTLFVVANLVKFDPALDECSFSEMDFFLRDKLMISVSDGPNSVVDQVRAIFPTQPKLAGPGRLFHRLLDAMVDRYLPVLDTIEVRIEALEDQAVEHTSTKLLKDIFSIKRSLIEFRRVTISMRDMLSQILRRDEPWLRTEAVYFRDVYDHLMRALEFTETYRDILTGVLEVHLTAAANRTNDIVKVMTLFATITLPILLITGYYGMNFDNLPLQHHPQGLYIATGIMAALVAFLLYAFKRTGWF
ncbi:MAG TPA: magnesium/cobalt transporter CorA [Candidatus Acidoferrales bacterium]